MGRSAGGRSRGGCFSCSPLAALGYAAWRLLGHTPYRIDIDVYRMGGRAWLDGRPLYADDAMFHTRSAWTCRSPIRRWRRSCSAPFAWLSLPRGQRRDHG